MSSTPMDRSARFSIADQAIAIGFWINACLMVMKLLAGYLGRSEAVFADGLESACDFAAMLSAMIALKIGRKPFDQEHPYGHGKAESIAAILVSLIIVATGFWILYRAVTVVMHREAIEPQLIAVLTAAATIIIKEGLCRYTLSVSRRLGSPAVDAIARDHRKDALTSVATLIGVAGAYFGVGLMDPLAAGLTAFFIFYIGWKTFRDATHDLMDGRPSQGLIADVNSVVQMVPEIEHIHEIRARRTGQYLIIDLKLDMDPDMTVRQSHKIAAEVKRLIFKRFQNVGDVMVHINPHEEEHEDLIRL